MSWTRIAGLEFGVTALAAFALYIASNARHQKVLEETAIEEEVKKSDQAHNGIDNPLVAEKQF